MTFNAAFDTPHERQDDVRNITGGDCAAHADDLMDTNRTEPHVAVIPTWAAD